MLLNQPEDQEHPWYAVQSIPCPISLMFPKCSATRVMRWESNSITVPPLLGHTQPSNHREQVQLYSSFNFSPFKCETRKADDAVRARDLHRAGAQVQHCPVHGDVAAFNIAARCEDLVAEERTRPMLCLNVIFGTSNSIGGWKTKMRKGSKSWTGRKKMKGGKKRWKEERKKEEIICTPTLFFSEINTNLKT